jgi:hypothetical protein
MLLSVLLGGLTAALTIGLLDVLVFDADAINSQETVSAGVDLAIGQLVLAGGGLVVTGRLHGGKVAVPAGAGSRRNRRGRRRTAGRSGCWLSPGSGSPSWSALIGIPGAAYLSALRNLITGKSSTATQVVAAVVVLIEFALIIIPFVFLELRPEAAKAALRHAQDWLLAYGRQLMACTALILGA